MNGNREGSNSWVMIFIIILILSVLFTMCSRSNQEEVEVYDESDRVETQTGAENVDTELDVDMTIYTDDEAKYSIQIPSDWEEVTKSGFPTYVHSPSASSIQIQVLDYDPEINNTSADTMSAELVNDGYTFLSYTRLNNSSYELLYQDFQNSTYDYVVEAHWDRNQIIKLVCTFNDENYGKIWPYYEKILDSFVWDQADPIPDGYYLYYNDIAMFEIGVPETWTLGSSGNAIAVTDPETGSTLTLSVSEYASSLSSLTAPDMMSLLNGGQNSFMMKNFTTSDTEAAAICTYVIDGVQYVSDDHLYSNGTYLYFAAMDYEDGMLDETIPDTCFSLFREFVPEISEDGSELNNETEGSIQPAEEVGEIQQNEIAQE